MFSKASNQEAHDDVRALNSNNNNNKNSQQNPSNVTQVAASSSPFSQCHFHILPIDILCLICQYSIDDYNSPITCIANFELVNKQFYATINGDTPSRNFWALLMFKCSKHSLVNFSADVISSFDDLFLNTIFKHNSPPTKKQQSLSISKLIKLSANTMFLTVPYRTVTVNAAFKHYKSQITEFNDYRHMIWQ